MEDGVKHMNRIYDVRGFHIEYILVDIQFKAIKDLGHLSVNGNVVVKGEHVPVL